MSSSSHAGREWHRVVDNGNHALSRRNPECTCLGARRHKTVFDAGLANIRVPALFVANADWIVGHVAGLLDYHADLLRQSRTVSHTDEIRK